MNNIMKNKFSIEFRYHNVLLGAALVLLGISAPLLITSYGLGINRLISESIVDSDTGKLVLAAFKTVILNSVRALPHYLGAFVLSESIVVRFGDRIFHWMSGLVALAVIPLVYRLIFVIYGINYDLGVPAFIVLLSILFLEKLNFSHISIIKKSSIIILLLLGVQWMDVIPQLTRFGFGRGEISSDIKMISEFIDGGELLTFASITFFLIFIFNAFLVSKILSDEHKLIVTMKKNEEIEKGFALAKIQAYEARNAQEIQSLVHDLKTPLTSIQALASVTEMIAEDHKIRIYMKKIGCSVDNLNNMISEILYEDKKSNINTDELLSYVLAQITSHGTKTIISCKNQASKKIICVNKIRLSRAIVNIIDNSAESLKNITGQIHVIFSSSDSRINIMIEDNGEGISQEALSKIWDLGYSTKKSTGLGLSFVKNVVENHDGHIDIISRLGYGTKTMISLPEVMLDES